MDAGDLSIHERRGNNWMSDGDRMDGGVTPSVSRPEDVDAIRSLSARRREDADAAALLAAQCEFEWMLCLHLLE